MHVERFKLEEPLIYLLGECEPLTHVEMDRGNGRRGGNVQLPDAIRSRQLNNLAGKQSANPLHR